jgi:hypothetical protein
VIGSLSVDIGQLYHLSTSLGTSAMAMDVNDQRPDAGQVGNSDVQWALDTFFGNWNYKRRDLVDRLKTVSQAIANTATTYGEMENNVKGIFEQILHGMLSSTGRGSSALKVTPTSPSGPLRVTPTSPSGPLHVSPPLPVPNLHVGPAMPRQSPQAVPTPSSQPGGHTGDAAGALSDSNRSWEQAQTAYDAKVAGYVGAHPPLMYSDTLPPTSTSPGGGNQYQCVSWAWFRMRELGYKGPVFSLGKDASGNYRPAGVMAPLMGGSPDTPPKLGAVMSYGGHVVIAEEVMRTADGHFRVRVSEMNIGNRDPAIPQDFSCSRWMNQSGPSGSWSNDTGKSISGVSIFNPDYSGK